MIPRSRRRRALRGATCVIVSAAALSCGRAASRSAGEGAGRFGVAAPSAARSLLMEGEDAATAVLAADAGVAGDRVSAILELPREQCAVLIARVGTSVEDVDLFAYGEDGSVLGSDEGPDKTPALLVCPPHPQRIWVTARIAAGHGLVAIGAQRLAPVQAETAAALYKTKSGAAALARAEAWPGLEERVAAHRQTIGGAWQDVRRVALPLDSGLPTRVSARVEAGRCLDAYLFPSDEVGHLEVNALDASGAILGRSQAAGRERFVVVCSPVDTDVAFELRPQSGRGVGVLLLSRTRAGSEADLDTGIVRVEAFPSDSLEVELGQLTRSLAQSGHARGKSIASGALEVGRRTSLPLKLPTGCSRVDVLGGTPLRGLEARVWSAAGSLLSHAQQGGHAVLFVCTAAGGARLDVEATLRGGPFAVLLHTEVDAPPALAAVPLAGARLLARVIGRGLLRRANEIGQVREVQLTSDRLEVIELTVPFGRCMDVALALDEAAIGAEVRIVAAAGDEVALSRGPHATSARVCSLDAATAKRNLKARAELRVAAGAGKGLVSTRMLSPSR